MNIDWGMVSGVATAVALGGGALVGVGQHVLRGWFVGHSQHRALAERVEEVEKRHASLPTQGAIDDFARRLSGVERDAAVIRAEMSGVNAGMKRVEHTVGLLLEHQLEKGQ